MLGFGHFGRVREKTRRLLAAAGVALLLGFQALSAAYAIHEADHSHDHDGDESKCPVCLQLRHCIANFHLTGPGLDADATTASAPVAGALPVFPAEIALPSRTLVALKVQFNE